MGGSGSKSSEMEIRQTGSSPNYFLKMCFEARHLTALENGDKKLT